MLANISHKKFDRKITRKCRSPIMKMVTTDNYIAILSDKIHRKR